jgi:hypothetical protein
LSVAVQKKERRKTENNSKNYSQTPTAETVSVLYDAFVELLTGKRDVKTPSTIPYPELHQHSLSSLNYLKTLSKLMLAVGVTDFSVMEVCFTSCFTSCFHIFSAKDLLNPDKKRLQKHLSALINITKFREEKLEVYSQWTKRTDELLETKVLKMSKQRCEIRCEKTKM